MSRLDLAMDRVGKALERLEKAAPALAQSRTRTQEHSGAQAERLAGLEAEREKLLERIGQLEQEMAALSGLTEEVEGRLDGAIGEIRAALAR